MKVVRIPAGPLDTNCYIVIDEDTKETAIIDPGGNEDRLISVLDKEQANPKYILLTHGHFDHTGAVMSLKNKYQVPVFIAKEDYELVHSKNNELFYMENYDGSSMDFITEETVFELGKGKINCIKTPGHSPGGVCFYVDSILFSGDTLFQRSIGRTDFYGGDYGTLVNSIKTKLMVLPENTTVLPGHGEETTIGLEGQYNPFL